jgi:phosphate-selective porin
VRHFSSQARLIVSVVCVPLLAAIGQPGRALAQESEGEAAAQDSVPQEETGVRVGYGDKGFELGTADGNFLLQIESRFQFRYAHPRDTDPVTFDAFRGADQHLFKLNRARLKVGGHAYRPWLKYYFEYEWAATNLLDTRLMVERLPYLRLKVGQWKVEYGRERVISSGKQQMMDRSIVNRPFTIDRQQGISLYGRLKASGAADFNYWAGVFTGTGRGSRENDDEHLMWAGRAQWNFLGRDVGFTGSDLEGHEQAAGLLALAAATNRSPYTRFSQAGGGQLEGFDEGDPGQYRVNQWMEETAFKYQGLAWQQEFHWKRIEDTQNGTTTTLVGNYAQVGYFLHNAWPTVPRPLEIAFLYAFYDPDLDEQDDLQQEFSLAANWFFAGHRNKLSADLTYFTFQDPALGDEEGLRFRLQWDISF